MNEIMGIDKNEVFNESEEKLNKLNSIISENNDTYLEIETINNINKVLHGWKGNVSMLGLKASENIIHLLEELFIDLLKIKIDFLSFKNHFEELQFELKNIIENEASGYSNDLLENTIENIKNTMKIIKDLGLIKKTKKLSKKKLDKKIIIPKENISVDLEELESLQSILNEFIISKTKLESLKKLKTKNHKEERLIEDIVNMYNTKVDNLNKVIKNIRLDKMEDMKNNLIKFVDNLKKQANISNKEFDFIIDFGDSKFDKMLSKKLKETLQIMVSNAITHGLETEEERISKKKYKKAQVSLTARTENGDIVFTIKDNGKGIDLVKLKNKAIELNLYTEKELNEKSEEELLDLIFLPNFSLKEGKVDTNSGRGLGTSHSKTSIEAMGGKIKVNTKKDKGTTFYISVPLTISLMEGITVVIKETKYVLPLSLLKETIVKSEKIQVEYIQKNKPYIYYNNKYIPIIKLNNILNIEQSYNNKKGMFLILEFGARELALFVDEYKEKDLFVTASVEKNFIKIPGVSTSVISGDGDIIFVLDIFNKEL